MVQFDCDVKLLHLWLCIVGILERKCTKNLFVERVWRLSEVLSSLQVPQESLQEVLAEALLFCLHWFCPFNVAHFFAKDLESDPYSKHIVSWLQRRRHELLCPVDQSVAGSARASPERTFMLMCLFLSPLEVYSITCDSQLLPASPLVLATGEPGSHILRDTSETEFHTPPPLEAKIATDALNPFPAPVVWN